MAADASKTLATCPGSPPTGCPPCPTSYTDGSLEGRVSSTSDTNCWDATICVDGDSDFLVAYATHTSSGYNNAMLVRRFNADGTCIGSSLTVTATGSSYDFITYRTPSVAMSAAGDGRLDWAAAFAGTCPSFSGPTKYSTNFTFSNSSSPSTSAAPTCSPGLQDFEPSVGIADSGNCSAWIRDNQQSNPTDGILFDPVGSPSGPLVSCVPAPNNPPYCYITDWQPCIAQNSDGRFCIVWADAETSSASPNFDIALQEYDSSGNAVGSKVIVNAPTSSGPTTEKSPAVAFAGENIVVVWVGPNPDDCSVSCESNLDCPSGVCGECENCTRYCVYPTVRIYGRQLVWDSAGPITVGDQFIADEPTSQPVSIDDANPTVAIEPVGNLSRYIIAWNSKAISRNDTDVHARYFDFATFQPLGHEFRLNRVNDATSANEYVRRVANSAQHTVIYTAEQNVLATWTASLVQSSQSVWFTQLPSDLAEQQCCAQPCCRGDTTGNQIVNGDDTEDFIKAWFNSEGIAGPSGPCLAWTDLCVLDINGNCIFEEKDVEMYVCVLIGCPEWCPCAPCANGCDPPMAAQSQNSSGECESNTNSASAPASALFAARFGAGDCNSNGVPDADDIANGFSRDCNANARPDECDLAFDTVTMDCNRNLVPDECETGESINCPPAIDLNAEGGIAAAAGAIADFRAWLRALDRSGMKPWEAGYAIKMRLMELGIRYSAS